jgi:hypothetical protein
MCLLGNLDMDGSKIKIEDYQKYVIADATANTSFIFAAGFCVIKFTSM